MYMDVPGLKLSEWRPPGGGIARLCGLSGPDWEGTVCSGAEEAPFSAGIRGLCAADWSGSPLGLSCAELIGAKKLLAETQEQN